MAELDVVAKGGIVVDGTGTQRYRADVGIRDGRIAAIGRLRASDAHRVLDADGAIVAPGFVDLHTHYDAQLFWDPYLTLSGWHGVTSVVIGNCGFGFAPMRPEMRERAMLTMTRPASSAKRACARSGTRTGGSRHFPRTARASVTAARSSRAHALLNGSPAIDTARTGACPATDQRGVQRLNDGNGDGVPGCDVGAYEYVDQCPTDPAKVLPGICGCGVPDTDANGNGVADCLVNGELKARLASVGGMLNGLTGLKNPTQTGLRAQIDTMTAGIVDYVKRLKAQIRVTNPKVKLDKLAKRLKSRAHVTGRARGHGLKGARKQALAALQALDAVVAAQ